MESRKRFKQLLASPGLIKAAGVGDAGLAKLVEEAGFPVVYMSGWFVSYTFGWPDVGLLTMNDMAQRARMIVDRVSIPVIADADLGYGGTLQIMQTVREYEKAGVVALHLEDMEAKKHGDCLPIPVMVNHIKAAIEARTDPDLAIIARTDAMAAWRGGIASQDQKVQDSLERSLAYVKAGADIIFVQRPPSAEVMKRFCKEISRPVMVSMGNQPLNEPGEVLEQIGVKIAVFPSGVLNKTLPVIRRHLAEVLATGQNVYTAEEKDHRKRLDQLLGADEFHRIESKYGD